MFFFFNDTATTEIYTLSLHDALPISAAPAESPGSFRSRPSTRSALTPGFPPRNAATSAIADRKSTRLNSSHGYISYAVFCLKKKKTKKKHTQENIYGHIGDVLQDIAV